MIAVETEIRKAKDVLERLADRVQTVVKGARPLNEKEKEFLAMDRRALRRLPGAYVARKGDGDVGESLTLQDGTVLPRLGKRTREDHSVFGMISIPDGRTWLRPQSPSSSFPCPAHSVSPR